MWQGDIKRRESIETPGFTRNARACVCVRGWQECVCVCVWGWQECVCVCEGGRNVCVCEGGRNVCVCERGWQECVCVCERVAGMCVCVWEGGRNVSISENKITDFSRVLWRCLCLIYYTDYYQAELQST